MLNRQQILTQPKPSCICCDSSGTDLYQGLQDRLFGSPGSWSLKRCNNERCGMLWLDPAPISKDIPLAYQDYYTHITNSVIKQSTFFKLSAGYRAFQYGYLLAQTTAMQRGLGKALAFFNFFKEQMDYPFLYFKHLQKGRLLELGVGSGDTLKLFSNWGWQVEGLDFDPAAVKHAASQGLQVYQGDIFSLHFVSDSFDALFSSHVLEHVPDPVALMQESLRVLKPGGIFVAVTPNASSKLHHIFKTNWRGLEPPRHLHIFTPEALLIAAKNAGLNNINIYSSNCSAIHIFYASLRLTHCENSKIKGFSLIKYRAYLAGWYLNLKHRFSPLSGEELVLIAYK